MEASNWTLTLLCVDFQISIIACNWSRCVTLDVYILLSIIVGKK